MAFSLRTKKTEVSYKIFRKSQSDDVCFFCDKQKQKIIKKYKYFIIIKNNFPYDRVAKTSHILFPKRHIKEKELNNEELLELQKIKQKIIESKTYSYMIQGLSLMSIPDHLHFHLIDLKS